MLAEWLATPTPMEDLRSEVAVRMRGASFGDRAAVLEVLRSAWPTTSSRLSHYRQLEKDYDDPPR